MDYRAAGRALATHIKGLPDFGLKPEEETYHHMGATITDGVLQASINYSVVQSRVQTLLKRFPRATTTTAFADVLAREDPEKLFQWQGDKMRRLVGVTRFLQEEGVETEEDLARWLDSAANRERFLRVRGIGPKTLDYFGILAGRRERAAVDVWLLRFLAESGLSGLDYDEAQAVLQAAARELDIDASVLDHSVWLYMSGRAATALGAEMTTPQGGTT